MYNALRDKKTIKELWEFLNHKYKIEDARMKKFIIERFLEYKIEDSKTVINQIQEYQIHQHEIQAKGIILSKSFKVVAVIKKLPPSWRVT